jgi:glycosyltransferase involved in cell wall biosynthesis
MRVTVLSYAMTAASTARQVEHLAARCALTLIRPDRWPWYAGEPAADPQGVTVVRLPVVLSGSHHLHLYRGLANAVADARPDLFYYDQEPWSLSSVQGVRAAARAGAVIVGFTWQNLMKRYPPPFPALERWVHRRTRLIVAGNEEAAAILRRRGYAGLVNVVPQFGVDPATFHPGPSTRADLHVPADAVLVGFVGRLVPEKGLATVLDALPRVPDLRLALAGVGPQEKALKAQAARLRIANRVHFLGGFPSDRVPHVMRALDALILPSRTTPKWKEQFGRVLIEAMATGIPVIGSSSAEIPTVIGDAGLVFKEGDVADCARALRALLDPAARRDLAARGLERVRAHYTVERIAERYWEAWMEAVAARETGTVTRNAAQPRNILPM